MTMAQQIYEGTWEEIAQHASELVGRRVRLTVLEESAQIEPNRAMLEALRKVSERAKNMPTSSDAETLTFLREARAGRMFGYDPAE
jgi:hypothetical protein